VLFNEALNRVSLKLYIVSISSLLLTFPLVIESYDISHQLQFQSRSCCCCCCFCCSSFSSCVAVYTTFASASWRPASPAHCAGRRPALSTRSPWCPSLYLRRLPLLPPPPLPQRRLLDLTLARWLLLLRLLRHPLLLLREEEPAPSFAGCSFLCPKRRRRSPRATKQETARTG